MVKPQVLRVWLAFALILGACSDGGTQHATHATRAPKSQRQPSPACERAMAAVATGRAHADEPTTFALQKATVYACPTRAEFLAAAARHGSGVRYGSGGIDLCAICGNETPAHALSLWCRDQSAPACKETR